MTFMTADLESPHFQGRGDVLGFPEQRIFSRTNPEMMCILIPLRAKFLSFGLYWPFPWPSPKLSIPNVFDDVIHSFHQKYINNITGNNFLVGSGAF